MSTLNSESALLPGFCDVVCRGCLIHPETSAILDNMALGARDDQCPHCGDLLVFPPASFLA